MIKNPLRIKVRSKLMMTKLFQLLKIAVIKCFMFLFILHFQSSSAQTSSLKETNYLRVENAEHIVVYQEENKFLGWPANNGA